LGEAVASSVDAHRSIQSSLSPNGVVGNVQPDGAGSSVMLALAAYNLGPSRVKTAVRKVQDPIKQRSFWYLYRLRAVPPETREYVPKVIAAMIIGRHPEQYGFQRGE